MGISFYMHIYVHMLQSSFPPKPPGTRGAYTWHRMDMPQRASKKNQNKPSSCSVWETNGLSRSKESLSCSPLVFESFAKFKLLGDLPKCLHKTMKIQTET